jgi:hypothetical protein
VLDQLVDADASRAIAAMIARMIQVVGLASIATVLAMTDAVKAIIAATSTLPMTTAAIFTTPM